MIDPAAFDLLKRQIEAQIGDYEHALNEYVALVNEWRSRNTPAGKRTRRFREASGEA